MNPTKPYNPGAKKKDITAIARTLLKIAYEVLEAGKPYQGTGADFCTRWESPAADGRRHAPSGSPMPPAIQRVVITRAPGTGRYGRS